MEASYRYLLEIFYHTPLQKVGSFVDGLTGLWEEMTMTANQEIVLCGWKVKGKIAFILIPGFSIQSNKISIHPGMVIIPYRSSQSEPGFQEKTKSFLSRDSGEFPAHFFELFNDRFPNPLPLILGQKAEVNDVFGTLPLILQQQISGVYPVCFDLVDTACAEHHLPCFPVPNQIGLVIDFELLMVIEIQIWIEVLS